VQHSILLSLVYHLCQTSQTMSTMGNPQPTVLKFETHPTRTLTLLLFKDAGNIEYGRYTHV
jgi:hypothetical protein